uniref:Uncharacterized protein n=1 Tax=Romanomermis culicivorax TaxID=13658 RepID=A0A915HSV6_ROMCU
MQSTERNRMKGKFGWRLSSVVFRKSAVILSFPTESGFSGQTFQAVDDPFRRKKQSCWTVKVICSPVLKRHGRVLAEVWSFKIIDLLAMVGND